MYALLDWDSTLRGGATIFTWLRFMIEKGVWPEEYLQKQQAIFGEYRRGAFSHDELSSRINYFYLSCIKGMSLVEYEGYLKEYLAWDRGPDIPTTRAVTQWLRERGAQIVVASGSPLRAISPNFPWMGVTEAFALREGVTGGRFDGRMLADGGSNKQVVVDRCLERYGEPPALAMGDSASDIPLLQSARLQVLVNPDEELRRAFPRALAIRQDEEGARMLLEALGGLEATVA